MSPTEEARAARTGAAKRKAIRRLTVMFGVILAVGIFVVFGGVVDIKPHDLQTEFKDKGILAPILYILISGALAALFVPGPIFAIGAGLLFGAWAGIPIGLCGAVVSALICREIGVHMGRSAAEELAGARLGQMTAWLDRYGAMAVIAFRLMPAMPDAPLNYAAGLTRLKRWQIAVGTFIGSIPRTLGWGLVGSSAGGGNGWQAAVGLALIIGADAGGVIAATLLARHLGMTPKALWRKLRGAPAEHASPNLPTMRIAIDGPAGAGKSTVARLVAERLEYTYLDTGAMYRCAALASLRGVASPGDVDVDFDADGTVQMGGEDVSLLIRTPEVTSLASQLAAEPSVREGLVARQRELMAEGDWVAEGRDVGTVVVPDAELKVFLDADPLERAQRRAEQLGADVREILAQQQERDERDRTRQTSPLKAADDAVIVDTTGLSIDQVVDRIADLARERMPAS